MTTQFALDSGQILLVFVSLAVFIFAIILGGRWLMRQRMKSNLTKKYKDHLWHSPLEARSKYPDVDVFRHSSIFIKLGTAVSLIMILALFSWTTMHETVDVSQYDLTLEEDFTIEPPRTAEPPPPPPPPPPPVIQEVPEELYVEDEDIEFMDQSVEADDIVTESFIPEEETTIAPPPPPPPPVEEVEEIFKVVEEMPRFPGCENLSTIAERKTCSDRKLLEFIYSNIQYPGVARENNIQGNVVVSFVVNKDGSIEQLNIVRDIGGGCGDEVLRVLRLMQDRNITWIPGKQREKPVRVQFLLPVKFILA